jgi:hypothetical protein
MPVKGEPCPTIDLAAPLGFLSLLAADHQLAIIGRLMLGRLLS